MKAFYLSLLKRTMALSVGVLVVFLITGCGPKEEEEAPSNVLATVGERAITSERFQHRWEQRRPARDTPETRQAMLEQLALRSAIVEQALAGGIEEWPAFQEALDSLIIAHWKERNLQPKMGAIAITDALLKERYEAGRETRFKQASRFQVAVLWFDSRGQAPLELRYQQRLEKAREAFLAEDIPLKEGFGKLSIANTEHRASRFKGGILGSLEDTQYPDGFRNAVIAIAKDLQPGELSEIVTRPEGIFLVRLIEQSDEGYRSFESVKGALQNELKNELRNDVLKAFDDEALAVFSIQYYPGRLEALELAPAKTEKETKRSFGP